MAGEVRVVSHVYHLEYGGRLYRVAKVRADSACWLVTDDNGAVLGTYANLKEVKSAIKETEVIYSLGDKDPTPNDSDGYQERCAQPCAPGGWCTWPVDHDGQHVAGDGLVVVGIF